MEHNNLKGDNFIDLQFDTNWNYSSFLEENNENNEWLNNFNSISNNDPEQLPLIPSISIKSEFSLENNQNDNAPPSSVESAPSFNYNFQNSPMSVEQNPFSSPITSPFPPSSPHPQSPSSLVIMPQQTNRLSMNNHNINGMNSTSSYSSGSSTFKFSAPDLKPFPSSEMKPTLGFPSNSTQSNNNSSIPYPLSQSSLCSIITQPEVYQVAKYNIYPSPELLFHQTIQEPQTIEAKLLYDNKIDIPEGFTNGDVQVIKPGQKRISFGALHLNLMTPIKSIVLQHTGSNSMDAGFTVKFRIGDVEISTKPFKLVSTVSQIPKGIDVRPRKSHSKSSSTLVSYSSSQPDKKRKKVNEEESLSDEEDLLLHVRVSGEDIHRGFINLQKGATLSDAREEISKSKNYPEEFLFWFEKMKTVVQPHQEEQLRAEDALVGSCLIIQPHDSAIKDVDKQILNLWTSKKDSKNPLVPISDLIRTLFSVYKANTDNPDDYTLIQRGITHFFVNIAKKDNYEMVTLDDFKLFLKFYGPPQDCLNRVFYVYREEFFHGFARHSDAVTLLTKKPGGFLFRYSESQLKDGYFAFNVNKGNFFQDIIENYSLQYNSELGSFIFRKKRYNTLRDFIQDPEYAQILREGIQKQKPDTLKESKYKLDAEFVTNEFSNLNIHQT